MKRTQDQMCTVVPPAANGVTPQNENQFGLTESDLKTFAERGSESLQWAQWYVGTRKPEALQVSTFASGAASGAPKRRVTWGKCEDMQRFARALTRQLFRDPTIKCDGGKFIYRIRITAQGFEMDMIEKHDQQTSQDSSPKRGRITRLGSDRVTLTDTAGETCPTRVVYLDAESASSKNFKLCLRMSKEDPTKASGQLGFVRPGVVLSELDRKVDCQMDEDFARLAPKMIGTEVRSQDKRAGIAPRR